MKTAHPVTEVSEGTIVRLFGPPRIERDGQVASVDTRKAFALFAYLAVTGRAQSRDHLAALLWPEANQTRARSALRRTLSALNAALGGRGLRIERESLALLQDEAWVDVLRFRDLCGLSDGGDLAALEEASELYGGEFLSGFGLRDSPEFDDWQLATSEELRREYARVLERLSDVLASSDPEAAIAFARTWVSLDLLHEPAHRALMRLYASTGERASALRQYRECVAALERDLGVEPLPETTGLYESIMQNRTTERAQRPVRAAPPLAATAELPLVGRDDELRKVRLAYASVDSDGRLVVVGGEPGIGKTRLVREFLGTADARDALVIEANCHPEEERLALGTIVGLLRAIPAERLTAAPSGALVEASRLVRELAPDATPPAPLDSPAARRRLFEGVADVIASAGARTILFVDDVQWIDSSSLDVLRFVVRRLTGRPLLVLLTWRTEEVPPAHPLRRMLADAERAGLATGITLQRFTQTDVDELLRRTDNTAEEAEGLFVETAGVPFFLSEYLKSDVRGSLPAGVRDLLASRVESASGTAGQVLTAAAVIGRAFDPGTVREASGRSEDEVVAALEELTARALIAESSEAYDFTHPKLREYVYEHTTLGRRRLLHARVARAADRGSRRRPELAAIAALHLERAGKQHEAAGRFRIAAEHARSIYANPEALAHFRSALALGGDHPAELHEAIGDLLTLEGRYDEAIAAFEKATALGGDITVLGRKLGDVGHRTGEWDSAEAHYLEAQAATTSGRDRARVLADRSLNAHRSGRDDLARELAAEASSEAASAGDPDAVAQAHNIEGILASHRGDQALARTHLSASLALAESTGDPAATAAALNNLALALRVEGLVELALAHAERAVDLCRRIGDRHREAAVHSNIADALRELGRGEESMEHLKTSATLFSDIGEPDRSYPEIWKLVEW